MARSELRHARARAGAVACRKRRRVARCARRWPTPAPRAIFPRAPPSPPCSAASACVRAGAAPGSPCATRTAPLRRTAAAAAMSQPSATRAHKMAMARLLADLAIAALMEGSSGVGIMLTMSRRECPFDHVLRRAHALRAATPANTWRAPRARRAARPQGPSAAAFALPRAWRSMRFPPLPPRARHRRPVQGDVQPLAARPLHRRVACAV